MSLTDRELLELAAKAAGIQGQWSERGQCILVTEVGMSWQHWRPLDDDGDALRLAIKLGICIQLIPECDTACAYQERPATGEPFNVHVAGLGDIETRRVITQAAAEIGKAMQEQH